MIPEIDVIETFNGHLLDHHLRSMRPLVDELERKGCDTGWIISQLQAFQVAIPSWALGAGGTRFGRFSIGGEPRNLEEKLEDIGLLHALNRSSGAISLHIPWDIPEDIGAVRQIADNLNLLFDAVNSNTFQDQKSQIHSYKFGSLCHTEPGVRQQAIEHNIEVIRQGTLLGSNALTIWLADGSSFPGQQNFRQALQRTLESMENIYRHMPDDWTMLIEYKPYEPHFYSMVIPDWGTSWLLASKLGPRAATLVDLGHHLPHTNIEQIVATLLMENKLGGFHFNDSRYGDDDLTTGSADPFQLFLLFIELTEGLQAGDRTLSNLRWMIDASHNLKDPLEDLLQSVDAILLALAQSLCLDRSALDRARNSNDVAMAQELLQDVFRADLRPLLREARLRNKAAIDPLGLYRKLDIRKNLIRKRGRDSQASGL